MNFEEDTGNVGCDFYASWLEWNLDNGKCSVLRCERCIEDEYRGAQESILDIIARRKNDSL